jgi:DNA-binding transcriptional MerR regulator
MEEKMTYTIAKASQITGLSVHTLRYYDKEGLLPYINRDASGIRRFKDSDFSWLRIITCLKDSGMPLKEIKKYIDLGMIGPSTTFDRLDIMKNHRKSVLQKIELLHQHLQTIENKIEAYEARIEKETINI